MPLPEQLQGRSWRVGYQPTIYSLVFDDLDGLEVKTYGTSIGQVKRFMSFANDKPSAEQTLELFEAFGEALIKWNLEDRDGQPVPATPEGIDGFPDSRLMGQIVNTWINTVSGVDEELGKDSSSGRPYPEASLPMEPLSENPAS